MSAADWINAVLAFVTALMAGGTVYLAWYTRNLAKDTMAGIEQAERHHREDLRPFCVIEFAEASDQNPFGRHFDRPTSSGDNMQGQPSLLVFGSLHNKGKGPATDIVVYLNKRYGPGEKHVFRLTYPVVVSGLIGAEETIKINALIQAHNVMKTWKRSAGAPVQVFNAIASDTYEVVLEYRDVFGNFFHTVHPRGIWHDTLEDMAKTNDKAKQHEMMARPNKPMPSFRAGKETMRTLDDIPAPPQISASPEIDGRYGDARF